MKTKLSLALLSLLFFPGCATWTSETTIAFVSGLSRVIVQTAVARDVISHPDHRAYFEGAVQSLNAFLAKGEYSPTKLAAAMESMPIKEFKGEHGVVTVSGAVSLLSAFGTLFDVQSSSSVAQIGLAIRDGVEAGLGEPTMGRARSFSGPKAKPIKVERRVRL